MRLPLVSALLMIAVPAFAQRESSYVLKSWETDDGLPTNVVNAVLKRSDGFLWVGTLSGVVRFDGVAFTPLEANRSAAHISVIRSLCEESPGRLLVAAKGPELWRVEGNSVAPHPLAAQFGPTRQIYRLFGESAGVFWIAFENRELWRWNQERLERFPAPLPPGNGETHFARDRVGNVYLSRGAGVERYKNGALVRLTRVADALPALGSSASGAAWMVVSNRIYRLDGDRAEVVADGLPWPAGYRPSVVHEGRDGTLWIALAQGGVWTWQAGRCAPVDLSFPKVRDICEDDDGDIWLATAGGGLDRLQPTRFSLVAPPPGVVAGVTGSVCEDATGNIWFGQHTAVFRMAPEGGTLAPAPAAWPARALPVCSDHDGNIWMGSDSELWISPRSRIGQPVMLDASNPATIRALFCAQDGCMWVGRENGRLERYRGQLRESFGAEVGFPENTFVQAIGEDSGGRIWVGATDGQLFAFQNGRFARFGTAQGLPGNSIRAIVGDDDGLLWVATAGGGLVVRRDGAFARIGRAEGLPDDTLYEMIQDDFGTFWFGSPRWLFRVTRSDLLACAQRKEAAITPDIFGRSDGLSGFTAVDGFQPNTWKTAKGRLWFVTRKGLVGTDPAEDLADRSPPRVVLDRFVVAGRPIAGASPQFKFSDGESEFHFTSPAYASPQDVRFRYRLDGLDAGWSEPTTQRAVSYPRLAPGRYTFKVEARDGDGPWSRLPATEDFEVLPGWWETWWARSAALIAAGTALGMFVRHFSQRRLKDRLERLELSQRVEAERSRIARDLHDSLGAGITRISMIAEEMCEDTDTLEKMRDQARGLMERAQNVADDLERAVWTVSPQNDNLPSLCAHLGQFCLEHFRSRGPRCRIDYGDTITPLAVPPDVRHHLLMMVAELANNVLKHARAENVELTMRLRPGRFELRLVDDGCGFDPGEATMAGHNGLKNLRARAAEIAGAVNIHSSARGTIVEISVPA